MQKEKRNSVMSDEERQDYWDTLCSFSGENPQKEAEVLATKIRYPRFLYRYRSVNSNNLEALRTNKLFFSQASKYDDPFDTFLHVDVDKIRQEFESNFKSNQTIATLADAMKSMIATVPNNLPVEYIQKVTTPEGIASLHESGLTDQFLSYALTLRTRIQDEIQSICFSENGFNETLWLKYANMHKGFALMYDLNNPENYHCGKSKKCKNCGVHLYGAPIYPVYYSDVPYDATNFAKKVMAQEMVRILGIPMPEFFNKEYGPMTWEKERNSLIKKECHRYDEEWRMIANCQMKPPAMIEWVPDGVIIGLRTSPVEENLIISMALQAGIKNIYKSKIDKENRLNAYPIYSASNK